MLPSVIFVHQKEVIWHFCGFIIVYLLSLAKLASLLYFRAREFENNMLQMYFTFW